MRIHHFAVLTVGYHRVRAEFLFQSGFFKIHQEYAIHRRQFVTCSVRDRILADHALR